MTDLHSLLVNEAPIGIAALSVEGTVLFWNKKAETIFGYTSEEVVGQSIHSLIVTSPHQEESQNALDLALAKGEYKYECISRRKDGGEFLVSVHLTTHIHEQQTIVLSAMRLLIEGEDEFHQNSVQETIGLLANMSHDLRTPLNSIIGFTEFLLEEQPGSLNGKQKAYLGDVLSSGKQLLNQINAILDLAKIDSGKIALAPEDFHLKAVFQQVLSMFTPVASKNNVQLKTEVTEDCGVVTLDLHKFKQVLFSLFSNAIKLSVAGDRIETVVRKSAIETLEIVISTTGSQDRDQEGGGLDLLLTKKILELQRGSLTIETTSGSGTSFILRLPARFAVSAKI